MVEVDCPESSWQNREREVPPSEKYFYITSSCCDVALQDYLLGHKAVRVDLAASQFFGAPPRRSSANSNVSIPAMSGSLISAITKLSTPIPAPGAGVK
jgi:hypothetical protein